MILGTTAAILLGATALAGTTAATSAINRSASKKTDQKAQQAINVADKAAEQKALMEKQDNETTNKARRSLLEAPTSGFGPNSNLARSFLTTL